MDSCEDYEQALGLREGEHLPDGGILEWTEKDRAMFDSRKTAFEAIQRTEYYRKAFSDNQIPEKKFCKIVPIASV